MAVSLLMGLLDTSSPNISLALLGHQLHQTNSATSPESETIVCRRHLLTKSRYLKDHPPLTVVFLQRGIELAVRSDVQDA